MNTTQRHLTNTQKLALFPELVETLKTVQERISLLASVVDNSDDGDDLEAVAVLARAAIAKATDQ